MSTNTDISKLDDLIVTTIDSVRGYEQAAEHAEAGRFRQFFADMAAERRRVVAALSEKSRELGGTPADYGSAAATLHRRWEDLRRVLGGGDAAIFAEIERGEDYLKEEYERAIGDGHISDGTRGVMETCFRSVQTGHDQSKALRDLLQTAD
ncbi:ferritin-like domain-containing protein [Sphingomonas sp. CJ20]